jgi:4-hydroxy-tetrahydrodipicolinate synthase
MKNDIGKYVGVWPVMLTPFDDRNEIDWASLEKLIDWYLSRGVHGLFANCQSSEMAFLSDVESVKLTRFVVDYVNGRAPVVASGHTATALSQQVDQLAAVAQTGIDTLILVSNRLALPSESDSRMLENLAWLVERIPGPVRLGVYECPQPYKRLLSDEAVEWCARSGRFTFVKDTCCSLARIERRAQIVKGTNLHIANANAQTLLESLQAGCHGYSGVMANFHPELYVWLYQNWRNEPEKAATLSRYLSAAALLEYLDYPVCAKDFQKSIGNFKTVNCRTREVGGFYGNHFQSNMQQTLKLGEEIAGFLGIDGGLPVRRLRSSA